MTDPTRGDVCVVACAEAFRSDGEILVSPMGAIPRLGALLARATFSPDILLTDGVATLLDTEDQPEGWMPFTRVFDTLWWGKRHVMMGATQIDRLGNQNISALGPHKQPKVQLLGVRGAPGNTICHATSYWVARHSPRVFVEDVDMVSGVGPTNGAKEIRRVVSDLGVFDFQGAGSRMRVCSLHPGVKMATVVERTGFALDIPDGTRATRSPTAGELVILERLDPGGAIRGSVTP